jgi:2-polyprenyl-3-methyl-5-hydroxy-6-metoxy-1,4-benzoquinol methylase
MTARFIRDGGQFLATPWQAAKAVIGDTRVTLGPQASHQLLNDPSHYCMVLARYRAAAALIGNAKTVLEAGSGEGIGALILATGRQRYCGVDSDGDAVRIARVTVGNETVSFAELNLTNVSFLPGTAHDAVVSLDVIEHIPADLEDAYMTTLSIALRTHGVCVIGTPSASFDHLASPQSKAGHVNTYTHDRLRELMGRYFHTVQMFGMQDTALHLGHPDARHYHLAVGVGPRREG